MAAGCSPDELLSAVRLPVDEPAAGSRRYAHLIRDGRLRVWALDRFPFLLFYRFAENRLEIVRILHERRNITRGLLWRGKR